MLKQRLLTAGILIPLVIAAIFLLPTQYLNYLIIGIVTLAAYEWLTMTGITNVSIKLILLAIIIASCVYIVTVPQPQLIYLMTMGLWLFASGFILVFANKSLPLGFVNIIRKPTTSFLVAILLFTSFSLTTSFIHHLSDGPSLLLYVLVTVWLADTGGYFAGKKFGKHKLASLISPNKTWEGVMGALVLSTVWAIIFAFSTDAVNLPLSQWLLINIIVVSISIIGDLFESLFKRQFNVKDSGHLLPGHGGILDRIDSLLAAMPVFAIILLLTGA